MSEQPPSYAETFDSTPTHVANNFGGFRYVMLESYAARSKGSS
jgi:hypothetical protein